MKRKYILILLICLLVLDVVLILTNNSGFIDDFIYASIISLKSPIVTNFLKVVTWFANTKVIIAFNIIIVIGTLIFKKKELFLIPLASIISVITNTSIKWLVGRERPLDIALIEENFFSFPSGHSMISVLFYGMIIYLVNKYKIKYYKVISCLLALLIFFIGMSRIYLGVHFATDVVGGWLVASIILITIIMIYKKNEREI